MNFLFSAKLKSENKKLRSKVLQLDDLQRSIDHLDQVTSKLLDICERKEGNYEPPKDMDELETLFKTNIKCNVSLSKPSGKQWTWYSPKAR